MRRPKSMPIVLMGLFVGATLFTCTFARADSPHRIALVIGNSRYEHVPQLKNPTNDAKLIAEALRDLGFEVIGGGAQTDLNRHDLEQRIRDFSYRLSPGSVGLFYYSGHGIQLRGVNYLVPVDANPTSARDADFELVDVDLLLRQMEDSGAGLNVVILDACRNNPFGDRGLKGVGAGLAEMQAPRGTIIAYATQPGGVAADGEGSDSPYTTALARLMKRPGLGILEMFNQVAVSVDQTTNHAQQPWTALSPISQDFYMAGGNVSATVPPTQSSGVPSPGPAPAAPPPGAADREVVYWETVQNSHNIAEFEAYLRQFPSGLFADIAQARIAELKQTAPSGSGRGQPQTPHNQQQALARIPPAPPSAQPAAPNIDQIITVIRAHTFWCFGDDHGFFRWRLDGSGNYAYSSYTMEKKPLREFGFSTSGTWRLMSSADRKYVIIERTHGSYRTTNPVEEVNDPQLGRVLGLRIRSMYYAFIPCDGGPVFIRKELP
jgi:hypothetical protein